MAKATKTQDPATNGTETATAEVKKPKIERIFKSSALDELRKKENQLNWKFNRIFAQVKKMGISEENQAKIQEILTAEHKQASQSIFAAPADKKEEAFV